MKSSKLFQLLKQNGWVKVRVSGSHYHFKHPVKTGLVTVPHPKKDIPQGTLKSILKIADIKIKEK